MSGNSVKTFSKELFIGHSDIRYSSLILMVYITFLPVSTALAGFITSSSIQSVIAVLFVFVSAVEIVVAGKFEVNKSLIPVYVYFLYMISTSIWNRVFVFDWYLMQFIVIFLIIICFSVREYSEGEIKLIRTAFYCSIFVALLSAVFSSYMEGGRMYINIFSRMDPNDFASGLAMAFGLCLVELMKFRKVLLNCVSLVSILVIVYFTGSRGGLLTMFCVTLVWLLNIKGRAKYKVLLAVFAVAALVIFCAETGIGPSAIRRFSITALLKDGGTGRSGIWNAAINYFLSEDPFHALLGNGFGAFEKTVRYVALWHDYQYAAHNMYINTLIEGGIVGLTLLITCFITVFIHAARKNNLFGILAVTGFIISGISLDTQVYRSFAIAVGMAVIWREINDNSVHYGILNRDKDPKTEEC